MSAASPHATAAGRTSTDGQLPASSRSPQELAGLLDALRANVAEVFLGKPELVRLAVVALLAEGQLDRFLLRVHVGYPDRATERAILTQHRAGEPVDLLKPVIGPADILTLQRHTREVRVDDAISDYILDLIDGTRGHPDVA